MPVTFQWFRDAAGTIPFDPATDTIGPITTAPENEVLYLGSRATSRYLQAASNPGVDNLVVSVADTTPGSGPQASHVKLATSSAGLDSATAGASLSLGHTLNSGAANLQPVHIRVEFESAASSDVSLSIALNATVEGGGDTWGASTVGANPNLDHWYKFAETSGSTVNDSAGSVNAVHDQTPTRISALMPGGVDGAINHLCYCTNGNYVAFDYGTPPHQFVSGTTTQPFTHSFWINLPSDQNSDGFVFSTEGMEIRAGGANGIRLRLQDDTRSMAVTYTAIDVQTGISIDDGTSHSIDITYDGSETAAGIAIYVDGLLQSLTVNSDAFGSPSTGNEWTHIGTDGIRANGLGQGPSQTAAAIDEYRIYSAALTPGEVAELYDLASGTTLPIAVSPDLSATLEIDTGNAAHYLGTAARWSALVTLDSVDISDQITGEIDIEAEENASALASFEIIPTAGTINLDDYERKPVQISFEGRGDDGSLLYTERRYTGITTQAVYDPDTGVLTIDCTTDLQGELENSTRAEIDAIVGGLWSEHVFDDQADGWQYAQDRLSTIASEIHVDRMGDLEVVPWAAGSVWTTFTDSTRFGGSLAFQRASRRELLSRVRINFDFRFVRLRHREIGVSFTESLTFCDFLDGLGRLASREVIASAADSNAWTRTSLITYGDLPAAGSVCDPPRIWLGDNDERFCLSASWTAARRWAQTITEEYTLDVIAPDVEEAIGIQATNLDYGIEAVYDASDYERITDFDGPPTGAVDSPDSYDWQLDATEAERTGRTAMEAAQSCALAVAKTMILDRARANRVTFEPVYDPTIDLSRTLRVNTPGLVATGKVAGYRETLDTGTGALTMRVELAISRHGGSGLAVDEALDPAPEPTQPTETDTGRTYTVSTRSGGVIGAAADNDEWDGWITNAYGGARTDPSNVYRERFVLRMPEIEAEAREAIAVQQVVEYEAAVPQDELTMVY
jgi:hypothetical protein